MKCPNCDSENNDSAKFCKKCGSPLKKREYSHEGVISSVNSTKSGNDKTKIIIAVLIVVVVVLAGAFIYLNMAGNNQSEDTEQVQENSAIENNSSQPTVEQNEVPQETQATQATPISQPIQATSSNPMVISGGSFSTGSSLSDKTHASIYVGSEHAGESVTIQILYSRDGSALNNGNMVPKTVDSSGYINVNSAEAYEYYPDYATINLYDSSGNLLDTQSVSLSPTSGTQSF